MKIIKRNHFESWKDGHYATVFFDAEHKYAYKVFRKGSDQSYERSKATCNSEIKAYELAKAEKKLSCYIPRFYNSIPLEKIEDEAGNDLSDQYFLDVNYKMEFIKGEFIKIGNFQNEKTKKLCQAFIDIGIKHIEDASVVLDSDGKIKKVVDFSIEYFEQEWS